MGGGRPAAAAYYYDYYCNYYLLIILLLLLIITTTKVCCPDFLWLNLSTAVALPVVAAEIACEHMCFLSFKLTLF